MRTIRWYTRSPTSRIKCSRPASPGSPAASTTSIDSSTILAPIASTPPASRLARVRLRVGVCGPIGDRPFQLRRVVAVWRPRCCLAFPASVRDTTMFLETVLILRKLSRKRTRIVVVVQFRTEHTDWRTANSRVRTGRAGERSFLESVIEDRFLRLADSLEIRGLRPATFEGRLSRFGGYPSAAAQFPLRVLSSRPYPWSFNSAAQWERSPTKALDRRVLVWVIRELANRSTKTECEQHLRSHLQFYAKIRRR